MTKTVALSDDAYDLLARLKRPGESFSDVVRDLAARRRPSIREVGGILAGDARHWDAFAKRRRAARAKTAGRVDLKES